MEKEKIRTFIKNEILAKKGQSIINDSDNLIENGAIDSLSILKVVSFIEKEFSIKIDDIDLLPENFETIDCIARFVQNKK
jgi:acyl carrier protein